MLRTHTSPVQIRTLQRYPPPIRVLAPGNVYRRDFFDASHAPMFAQIEGLAVDEGMSFRGSQGDADAFREAVLRGVEADAVPSVVLSVHGAVSRNGRRSATSATARDCGWVEIMGCGMVHPAVLEKARLDSEQYTGWAFGMGPARIAQSRYGIPDCRVLFDSDMRFLGQFATNEQISARMAARVRPHYALAGERAEICCRDHAATLDGLVPLRADLVPFVVARVIESGEDSGNEALVQQGGRRLRARCSTSCAARRTSRLARCIRSRAPAR